MSAPVAVVLDRVIDSAPSGHTPVVSVPLFVSETFVGVLVSVAPGQAVPVHAHDHKDEAFDVIEGSGIIVVGEREVAAGPGTLVFVPAGTKHGLRNTSQNRWLLRETVHERVYARAALRLIAMAVLKRLPIIGERWRD